MRDEARRSPDLIAVILLAVLGLLLALMPGGGWPQGVILALLAVVLPGYALAAALFPFRAIPAAERAVYTFALGIAIPGLGGVLTQILFNLDRGVFAGLLAGVTLVACWVAGRRRASLPAPLPWPSIRPPRFAPLGLVAFLLAGGIAAGALSLAVRNSEESLADAHFSELWALPTAGGSSGGRTVSIGVGNHEGQVVAYSLLATQGEEVVGHWRLRLQRGAHWRTRLHVSQPPSSKPLRVTLRRGGRIYRDVFVASEAAP
jgi:uncharacterized membrane protein